MKGFLRRSYERSLALIRFQCCKICRQMRTAVLWELTLSHPTIASLGPFLRKLWRSTSILSITILRLMFWEAASSMMEYTFSTLYRFAQHLAMMLRVDFKGGLS
jgi:hypothetical protein